MSLESELPATKGTRRLSRKTKKLSLTEGQHISKVKVPGFMSEALQESEKGSKLLRYMLRSLEGLSTASPPCVLTTQLSKNEGGQCKICVMLAPMGGNASELRF